MFRSIPKTLSPLLVCLAMVIDGFISLHSQPDLIWVNRYRYDEEGDSDRIEFYSVIAMIDSGFLLAGSKATPATSEDAYVLRTDLNGDTLWTRRFGGDSIEIQMKIDRFYYVMLTDDGGCILAGSTSTFGEDYATYCYAVRLDESGGTVWANVYGRGEFYSTVVTSDGGFAFAGSTDDYVEYGSWDAWLLKTNSEGEEEWMEVYGSRSGDYFGDLKQTTDGGYILVGGNRSDMFWVKADSLGQVEWSEFYGDTLSDGGTSVVITPDGGYTIAGWTTGMDDVNGLNDDPWIVRLNSEGEVLWTQTYDWNGYGYDEWFGDIKQTADNGFIAAGRESHNYYIVRTDSTGEMLWDLDYYQIDGHYVSGQLQSITRTYDGGYAAAGNFSSYGSLLRFGPDPIQPNRAPGEFDLSAPEDNYSVDSPDSALLFDWADAADPDSDEVNYVLYLQHQHPDDSTRFQIDAHHSTSAREEIAVIMHITRLWPRFADTTVAFSWWVEADDGALMTESLTRRTLFVPPPEGILDFGLRILDFGLGQPYPNPFNESVTVSFVLPFSSAVRLRVIDQTGREVTQLTDGFRARGRYQLLWNAAGLPAGTYLLRLDSRLARASRVVTLVK